MLMSRKWWGAWSDRARCWCCDECRRIAVDIGKTDMHFELGEDTLPIRHDALLKHTLPILTLDEGQV